MKIKKYTQVNSIEAIRITTKNIWEVRDWCVGELYNIADRSTNWGIKIEISFDEYCMGKVGDWVIRNSDGKFFTMRDKFFKESYMENK
jgi:hypothetical protein